MLTGKKDGYISMETTKPTVEDGTAVSGHQTPTEGGETSTSGTLALDDISTTETGIDALDIQDGEMIVEERSGVIYRKGQPLSTRFSTPLLPGLDFQLHETPNRRGAMPHINSASSAAESGRTATDENPNIHPFITPHSELGVPDHPLFKIQQLGVDRRMLVNRKEKLTMHRRWLQCMATRNG